ncbi:MAG TPA: PQQ-binding-like beta-propeller repeat protein [Thermomicrobiales bacterium]|nr:PQQ-binding-like beta-propeller repeat protein [Thermomicrobiales bacterium]
MAIDERDDRAAMDRLDRYLDRLADRTGGSPEDRPLDAELTETIRRFGMLGDRPNPDPAFVANLEKKIVDTAALTGSVFPSPPLIPGLNGRATGRWPARPSVPSLRPRRSWPLAQLSSAALFVVVLLASILVLTREQAGPGPIGNVPMFRGGAARTGEQPGPGPHGLPTARWTFTTGGRALGSPSVADGIVYAGADDGVLHALDARTGVERWQVKLGAGIGAAPAIVDGAVYVGDQAGNLYALDAATGAERWHVAVGAGSAASLYASSPVAVDGAVYVASGGGASTPAVAGGVVYVGGVASASLPPTVLHALDAATGAARWRYPTATTAGLTSPGVYAIDAATGTQRWHVATAGDVRGAPAVAGGIVYAGSKDGSLSAIDAATGAARWQFATGKAITSSPAVVDGVVYVGSTDGNLYALDAGTGAELWRAAVGAVRKSAPAVADDAVYVVADGTLIALDAGDGSERWRVPLGQGADTSPVVAGGMVFVGSIAEPAKSALVTALGDAR